MTFKRAEMIFRAFVANKRRLGPNDEPLDVTCRELGISRVELSDAVLRVCEH